MSRVTVVGTGYVGTVTAVCLAWLGHEVSGLDVSETQAAELASGQVPFYEPGLPGLLAEALATGRLEFTADPDRAYTNAEVVFLCVGTPPGLGGRPELSQLEAAVAVLTRHLRDGMVVVNKSTVPVGSGGWVRTAIEEALPRRGGSSFGVVSNPEFLREGAAIEDFLYPDRIVLGGEQVAVEEVASLYQAVIDQSFPGGRPQARPALFQTSLASAEMVKYASNAFLATKVSFANEMANLCELIGADAAEVLPAIGADSRIGDRFLSPGVGWGGSCFGKDMAALIATGEDYGYRCSLLKAAVEVNTWQQAAVPRKLQQHLKVLKGKRIALLGLAFKPGTDDLRAAPALAIAARLMETGAVVSAYDPVVKELPGGFAQVRLGSDPYDTADRADAVVLVTEWPELADIDLGRLADVMAGHLVVDGRNVLDRAGIAGRLEVVGIGW